MSDSQLAAAGAAAARFAGADGVPPRHHGVLVDAVPPQAWRNGGGLTRELLAWPPGAAEWQLRVSVADITRDGPFSAFEGVQRWFQVLSGAGVVLGADAAAQPLTPADGPWAFDGEAAPACHLLDGGATRDLNLMARRSAGRAWMGPVQAGQAGPPGPRWRGLFAAEPLRWRAADGAWQTLPAMSLLWSDDDGTPAWWMACEPAETRRTLAPLRAWWLALWAHP